MPKAQKRDGVYERTDRPGWWVSYVSPDGERVRKKVTASTRTQALAALGLIKHEEERALVLGIRPDSDISLEDLLERFKRYQKVRVRPATFEGLDGIFRVLKKHFPAKAKDIKRATVSDFITARLATVKPATVNKEVFTLGKALRLAATEWGLLNRNVVENTKFPKEPEGRTRYLTPGELRAALEAAPEWMRGPMAFAACTGVRRGELLSLRWMDVDLKKRRLYLRETKNGTLRILPLSAPALEVLGSLPPGNPGDQVFAGVNAMQLSVYCRRIFHRLGIHDASFHTLRHTAASWLVMEGADLYAVGQVLGHKTTRMTQRYAHLSPDFMAATAGKLDGIMGGVLGKGTRPGRILGPGLPNMENKAKSGPVRHRRVTRKSH